MYLRNNCPSTDSQQQGFLKRFFEVKTSDYVFLLLFLSYPVSYVAQYSAWKMKVVFFIIVFTSSFSGWFGFKRSISVSSIIFLSVTLHKPDISDTI